MMGYCQDSIPRLSNKLPVVVGNDTVVNAWAGGIDAGHFSNVDMNNDGIDDVVNFDRSDHSFTVFLSGGEPGEIDLQYAPSYTERFSHCEKCFEFALFVDYNCDGRKDLFCGAGTGDIWVYDNVLVGGDSVTFELEYAPASIDIGSPLAIPLFYNRVDVPAIVDVDWDGDLDFLTFSNFTQHVYFARNMAQEDYGRCDTLAFVQETLCWGHFFESNTTNEAFLFDSSFCPIEIDLDGRFSSRHLGSTLLVIDMNGDSLYDALIGDVSYANMYAVYNGGLIEYAYMDSVEVLYPQLDDSIDVSIFPGAYYVDVDNDAKRDLLVAPHARSSIDNTEGVWYYKNEGVDEHPSFGLEQKGFLQDGELEFGGESVPTFLDYNGDGLLDLMVGNSGYYNVDSNRLESGLALYENVGTEAYPTFSLVSKDYLDFISSGTFPTLQRISPTGGDIDGDGDMDLFLGCALGTIYYFENVAMGPGPAVYQYVTDVYEGIDVGLNSAPILYDIDSDSDLDLFVGDDNGHIWYYENVGDSSAAVFDSVTNRWGFVRATDEFGGQFSKGRSKPLLLDHDGDGEAELFLGETSGSVRVFEGVGDALTDTLVEQDRLFDFDFGEFVAPAIAPLDTTGMFTYVVGNSRGGLLLWWAEPDTTIVPDDTTGNDTTDTTSVSIAPWLLNQIEVQMYPNPTTGKVALVLPARGTAYIEVSNVVGKRIIELEDRDGEVELDMEPYAKGIYYVRVQTDRGRAVLKLVRE